MMKPLFFLMSVLYLGLVLPVQAQPAAPAGSSLPRQERYGPPQEGERLQRRERMRLMREALLEQRRLERADAGAPPLPVRNAAASESAAGHGRREGLRRLEPEERQRLRREMREAARELYRR